MKTFSLRFLLLLTVVVAIPLASVARRYHARLRERGILLRVTQWREAAIRENDINREFSTPKFERHPWATASTMSLDVTQANPPADLEVVFGYNARLDPGNFCWETWPWRSHWTGWRPRFLFPQPDGEQLDLGSAQLTWADLWGEQKLVRQVLLAGGWERPEELDQLAGLGELQLLTYCFCGDESAVRAIRATQPPFFYAPYAAIGDPTCEALAANPRLRGVTILVSPWMTDRGAAALARAPQLQAVSFDRCDKIGSTGVAALLAAPKLEWLIVRRSQCDDSAVAGAINPKLIHLELEECRLTDAAAERLSQCDSLARLSLCGTQVTDRGALKFARLPKLRWLMLCDTCITDDFLRDAFASPENFPALEWIRVCGTRCTLAERDRIQRLRPKLRIELPYPTSDGCWSAPSPTAAGNNQGTRTKHPPRLFWKGAAWRGRCWSL